VDKKPILPPTSQKSSLFPDWPFSQIDNLVCSILFSLLFSKDCGIFQNINKIPYYKYNYIAKGFQPDI